MDDPNIISIRLEPELKSRFKKNCETEGSNMSVEIRKFIHRYNRRVENSRINHKTVNK
jgi:predicted DNA-binding protein